MESEDIDALTDGLALTRKKEMNFGICLGKKPEEMVFFLHPRKASDVLMRQAKKAGNTNKVFGGVATSKGSKLTLSCEGDPPSGAAKKVRKFLQSLKMPLKIIIADGAGGVLEDDGEDAEDGSAPDAGATSEPTAEAAQWQQMVDAMSADIARFAKSDHEKADTVAAVWEMAQKFAAMGRFEAAIEAAEKTKPYLTGTADIAKGTVAKRAFMVDRWKTIRSDLSAQLKVLVAKIPDAVPWEDPQEIQALVGGKLAERTAEMQSAIMDGFDADVNSGDGAYAATRAAISAQRAALDSDALIAALRENTIVDGSPFALAVEQGLSDIDAQLGR